MIKKCFVWGCYLISLVMVAFGSWFSWNIAYDKLSIVAIHIYIFLEILYFLANIICVMLLIRNDKRKSIRIISVVLTIIVWFYTIVFTGTVTNIKLNFVINKGSRQEIIRMINDGRMERYRFGSDKYKTPFRLSSHTNKIILNRNDDNYAVTFYVNRGVFRGSMIVYISNEQALNRMLDAEYIKYGKLEDNWYYVITR